MSLSGGEGCHKDDLLNRPYLIKKDDKVGGSKIADLETTEFMDGPILN